MEKELTYKQGLIDLCSGLCTIGRLLPRTFAKQTKRLVCNHPLYILFFASVIGFQCYTIASERVSRDVDSHTIYELQHTLDSLQGKQVKYYSFNARRN